MVVLAAEHQVQVVAVQVLSVRQPQRLALVVQVFLLVSLVLRLLVQVVVVVLPLLVALVVAVLVVRKQARLEQPIQVEAVVLQAQPTTQLLVLVVRVSSFSVISHQTHPQQVFLLAVEL
jgi:hypothetical protein